MSDLLLIKPGSAEEYNNVRRYLKIKTALGEAALLLTEVRGADHISRPFCFNIEFVSRLPDSAVLTLLGKSATLFLCCTSENPDGRAISGLFRNLSGPGPQIGGFKRWRAELVPQLYFLGYTTDCRIFQNRNVIEIIENIFEIHQLRKYEIRALQGDYPKLEYCVQYRETALNFVSRLMEDFGLYFWHEHNEDGHTLIITDSISGSKPVATEPFNITENDQLGAVRSLEADYTCRPGLWTLKDFDFVSPRNPLVVSSPTMISEPNMINYEIFEYPGGYSNSSLGTSLSRMRIEQEETLYHGLNGVSSAAVFDAGRNFELYQSNDTRGAEDPLTLKKYLLVEVNHRASDQTHITLSGSPPSYDNTFRVVPANGVFRPQRLARKPHVQGPQTAIVTGPPGEQIYTDEHGRVKVRFHWDRNPDGESDEKSSCWLRVSQVWANEGWGAIHIPRVGEEVIVDFLEGNPDKPIITGRVYNGDNKAPYALPANKTQSGVKSKSVPSGGSNEFRFEDKQGSEEIWLHAQGDFTRKIKNNENVNILANENRSIFGNLTESVAGAVTEKYETTLTQTVADSISVSCPKVTFNVPGALFINTPSTTELKESDITAGSYKLSAYGVGVNAYGSYLNAYGQKMDITGLKLELTSVAMKSALVEVECMQTKVKVYEGLLKNTVTKIETAITHVTGGAMLANNYGLVIFS